MFATGHAPTGPAGRGQPRHASLSHVEFQVADAAATAGFFTRYGFHIAGTGADGSLVLRQGSCCLLLTEAAPGTGAAAYVAAHGDGVADIALAVDDATAAFTAAVAQGAEPVVEPARCPASGTVTAAIAAFGDVVHTLVQPGPGSEAGLPPGFRPAPQGAFSGAGPRLTGIDHFAVCLEPGQLDPATAFYRQVLGFQLIFEERVVVGNQAMLSAVVQGASRQVTLTLIQPDPTERPGQIDEFLVRHGGPGVQHVAFATADIVHAVQALQAEGVEFLDAPDTYYDQLPARIPQIWHELADLRRLRILADQDHDGQLFQIFTRTAHPRHTLFFEVIERLGARTFGSGNIKSLYEAVEAERLGRVNG